MSAAIVLEDGELLCFWQGELPKDGDVILVENNSKFYRVTTVVHVMRQDVSKEGFQTVIPSRMRRIFVEDLEAEGGNAQLGRAMSVSFIGGW